MMGLLFAALFAAPGVAQDGYRTPPDAITKILDSPAPPAVSVSSDRRWLLITTADVPETSIAELAEPTLFLAGRRFQTQPTHRIDFEGVRTASLKPVDGGAEITIPVPDGARLTQPQWSRDAKRLAYFVMTPDRMTLHIFDVATKASRAVTGGPTQGRLAPSGGWSRDGKHFLFSATTREGEALWVADVDAGTAKRLTPPIGQLRRRRMLVDGRARAGALPAVSRGSRRGAEECLTRRPDRSCRNRTAARCRRAPTPTC